jgi:tetratricopeptide (TPR) repeat protein
VHIACNLAIQEYEKVLNLDASHRETLRNLAYLLYQIYRLQEPGGYYRKGLSSYPDDPRCCAGSLFLTFVTVTVLSLPEKRHGWQGLAAPRWESRRAEKVDKEI